MVTDQQLESAYYVVAALAQLALCPYDDRESGGTETHWLTKRLCKQSRHTYQQAIAYVHIKIVHGSVLRHIHPNCDQFPD